MESRVRQDGINTVSMLIAQMERVGTTLRGTYNNLVNYLDHLDEMYPNDSEIGQLRQRLYAI